MTNETKKGDFEFAAELGAALAPSSVPAALDGHIPYLVAPAGYTVHDLEHLLPTPTRKRADVTVSDSDSFIAYTKKHGSLAECVIYAELNTEAYRFTMVGVLDDHPEEGAAWRQHTCTFAPALSVEWKRWTSSNKRAMTQAEFATWLEDNMGDIAGQDGMPTGAQMLQMAIGFERTADKRLKSRINLQSGGTRFEYVDDEDKDTRTAMDVFQRFAIGIPVLDGSKFAYPVEARLKYRERDGKVSFWFEMIRPDKVFKQAVHDETSAIIAATGFLLINGLPGLGG